MLKNLALTGMIIAGSGIAMATTASAKVNCKDGFQFVKSAGYIATPYCEIKYLA